MRGKSKTKEVKDTSILDNNSTDLKNIANNISETNIKKSDKTIIQTEHFSTITDGDMYYISFYKPEYEFVGISAENTLTYKKHIIKLSDNYNNIRTKLLELINNYPNLTNLSNIQKGLDTDYIVDIIKRKWCRIKRLDFNLFYRSYVSNFGGNDILQLNYQANSNFTKCIFNKLFFNNIGELYIGVTYMNNGYTMFGTLNKQYEEINLRDIDNKYWYISLEKIFDLFEKYLKNINYDDKIIK